MTSRKIAVLVSAALFVFLFSFETMAQDKKAAPPAKKEAKANKGKGKKDKGEKKDAKKKDNAVKDGEEKVKKPKKVDVKKVHSEAVKFYKEGNYEEAVERFKEANKLIPNPVTLFNIARCYEKLYMLDMISLLQ